MKNITCLEPILNSIANNIPLILSTLVNVVAIGFNFKQSKLIKQTEAMKIYAEKQFAAYENLLQEVINCGTRFTTEQTTKIIAVSIYASAFSSERTGKSIDEFCKVFTQIVFKGSFPNISKEDIDRFQKARDNLVRSLRKEIFRYENQMLPHCEL